MHPELKAQTEVAVKNKNNRSFIDPANFTKVRETQVIKIQVRHFLKLLITRTRPMHKKYLL